MLNVNLIYWTLTSIDSVFVFGIKPLYGDKEFLVK